MNGWVRLVVFCVCLTAGLAAARPASAQSPEPIAPVAPEPPPTLTRVALLKQGQDVTLRLRQVIPCDGLSPGERLLNGRPALQKGDRILAEVVVPGPSAALVGGTVGEITPPGRFSKPGRIRLELGQLVTAPDGQIAMTPWAFDLEDRRLSVQRRRHLLLALFAAEGMGIGASVGSQLGSNNPLFVGGGAGVGLLTGIGYASLMPGQEASLEPGDTFRVRVGTLSYCPIPASPQLELHPAADPSPQETGASPVRFGAIAPALMGRLMIALFALGAMGCEASRWQPAEAEVKASNDLAPAYTRDKILDPALSEVARSFTAWVEAQKARDSRIFERVEILPPAPTLLPYGIGTYQKEMRLPVILITGAGWAELKPTECEAVAARAYEMLTDQLKVITSSERTRPTLTIQTRRGLELGWINGLEPGRKLLHGVD